MSSRNTQNRLSLWHESLLALKTTLRHEWYWVVVFAALMSVEEFLVMRNFDMSAYVARFQSDPVALANDSEAMTQIMAHAGRDFVVQGVLGFIASFIFTVLYLRREAVSSPPKLSMENFVYWFGRICQKYSILFLPLLMLEIFAVSPMSADYSAEEINMIILGFMIVWAAYYLFFVLRLSLVTPLAILHRDPVVQTSWNITKGRCWQIFLSGAILLIILLPVFLAPYEIGIVCGQIWGNLSVCAHIFWALAQGLWGSVVSAAVAVYYCTVYRILLQEQRNSRILGDQ